METLALTAKQIESFWARVDKTDTCWNWTRGTTKGYAHLRMNYQMVYGHRLSYQLVHGVIPSSQHLDHICHNTRCVNPDHLRPVTRKENRENLRGAQRGNVSGVRGVTWAAHAKRWRAGIGHNNKQYFLGYFETIKEAEAVVVAKRNEWFTHNDLDRGIRND